MGRLIFLLFPLLGKDVGTLFPWVGVGLLSWGWSQVGPLFVVGVGQAPTQKERRKAQPKRFGPRLGGRMGREGLDPTQRAGGRVGVCVCVRGCWCLCVCGCGRHNSNYNLFFKILLRSIGIPAMHDDPKPGSSGDHLRQPTVETDVQSKSRSVAYGSRRRHFSTRAGATKIEKQTTIPTIVDR